MIVTFLAFLSLLFAAVAYFYARIKVCLPFLLTFYALSLWASYELFGPDHRIVYSLFAGIFVMLPLSLLMAFALDVRYGWFCFDMSYAWAVVWAFAPVLLGINLIGIALRLIMHRQAFP